MLAYVSLVPLRPSSPYFHPADVACAVPYIFFRFCSLHFFLLFREGEGYGKSEIYITMKPAALGDA